MPFFTLTVLIDRSKLMEKLRGVFEKFSLLPKHLSKPICITQIEQYFLAFHFEVVEQT